MAGNETQIQILYTRDRTQRISLSFQSNKGNSPKSISSEFNTGIKSIPVFSYTYAAAKKYKQH
jgi:hypothetical protein